MIDARLNHALSGERTPKFLATLGADGRPNCVPVTSLTPWDDSTLVFGEFFMNKTRKNLLENSKVGVAVVNEKLESWSLKGTFLGFETTGPHVEWINQQPLFRYNAYTSARAAGIIRVDEVLPALSISRSALLVDLVRVRLLAALLRRDGTPCMPRRVEEKFQRVKAVRAIAFRDATGELDNARPAGAFPRALTVMACVPVGANRLLLDMPMDIPTGTDVAVSIITFEPVAYQVKGKYQGRFGGCGLILLSECYSASPPLLGERLHAFSPNE